MITHLTILSRVILDASTQIFEVVEHHERPRFFGLIRHRETLTRCYYVRAGVGWCDDSGPLSPLDPRVLMLNREVARWRNREALDGFVEVG